MASTGLSSRHENRRFLRLGLVSEVVRQSLGALEVVGAVDEDLPSVRREGRTAGPAIEPLETANHGLRFQADGVSPASSAHRASARARWRLSI